MTVECGLPRWVRAAAAALACCTVVGAEEPRAPDARDALIVEDLSHTYDRMRSRIMVRRVKRATRARLDFAAYDRNIMFHVPRPERPVAPRPRPKREGLHFGGTLVPTSVKDRLSQTPLTEAEKRQPMAVTPLLEYLALWNYDAAEELLVCDAAVSEEKWGNAGLARPLQRMVTAYLHETRAAELWVKVEFEPTVTFLDGVSDEDGDGYREIYGRVAPKAVTAPLVQRIRKDYIGRTLNAEEVRAYFYKLVSGWYPTYNTFLLDAGEIRPWPNQNTETEIRRDMDGCVLRQATAVIRGKPHGVTLYNVFLVPGIAPAGPGEARSDAASPMQANVARWRRELAQWGDGRWEGWVGRVAAFRKDVRRQLDARPAAIKGLAGRDGFLFFRGSLEYVLAGDLRQQKQGRDPFPAIVDYHRQLRARGIDLLLVIIPAKPEVYPGKISAAAPRGGEPYVAPYTRKLLLELAEAGVEAVDLLPAFLAARDRYAEPLYMTQDTHWSNAAVRVAAGLIGERVKRYPWFPEVVRRPKAYTVRQARFTRAGDIRRMLRPSERVGFRPMTLTAEQVINPDGRPYKDDPDSPIVMLGDSFCGVFHFEDCKHAGVSAHLAREIGAPIDLIMAHGSGPRIRVQLSRRGAGAIARKRLVIWTVVARDLHKYWAPWGKVRVP